MNHYLQDNIDMNYYFQDNICIIYYLQDNIYMTGCILEAACCEANLENSKPLLQLLHNVPRSCHACAHLHHFIKSKVPKRLCKSCEGSLGSKHK